MYIRFYGKCKKSRKNSLLIFMSDILNVEHKFNLPITTNTLQSNYFMVIASSIY